MKTLEYQRTTTIPIGVQAVFVVLCGLALSWLAVHVSLPILLAAFGALGYCILFLQRPDLGLLAMLAVRPSTDVSIWLFGMTTPIGPVANLTPNAGLVLILIGCGALYMLSRSVPFLGLPSGVLLVLFQLVGLMAVMRSQSIISSLNQWLAVASAVIVYALAAHLFRTPKQIQRVIDVLAISFIPPAIFGLWQFAHSMYGGYRVWGTFVDAPAFSQYLVLILSVFTGQFLVHSGARKFLATVIVLTSGVLMIATYTRGAWAGALAALLMIAILGKRVVLVFALIVMVFAARMIPAIDARIADLSATTNTFTDRQSLWQSTIQSWATVTTDVYSSLATALNRLGGLGPKSQPLLTGFTAYGENQVAHNDYLRIAIEYGIIGLATHLLLMLTLAIFAYRTFRRCTDKRLGAVAMSFIALIIGYSIVSLAENVFGYTYLQIPMWTLAGLIVAIARLQTQGETRQPAG